MTNAQMIVAVKQYLLGQNFTINQQAIGQGATGPDFVAAKGNTDYYIEVIGASRSGPTNTKAFHSAFFQAISRLQLASNPSRKVVLVMAMPASPFYNGRNQRKAALGQGAWNSIGNAFSQLEIWTYNNNGSLHNQSSWTNW